MKEIGKTTFLEQYLNKNVTTDTVSVKLNT